MTDANKSPKKTTSDNSSSPLLAKTKLETSLRSSLKSKLSKKKENVFNQAPPTIFSEPSSEDDFLNNLQEVTAHEIQTMNQTALFRKEAFDLSSLPDLQSSLVYTPLILMPSDHFLQHLVQSSSSDEPESLVDDLSTDDLTMIPLSSSTEPQPPLKKTSLLKRPTPKPLNPLPSLSAIVQQEIKPSTKSTPLRPPRPSSDMIERHALQFKTALRQQDEAWLKHHFQLDLIPAEAHDSWFHDYLDQPVVLEKLFDLGLTLSAQSPCIREALQKKQYPVLKLFKQHISHLHFDLNTLKAIAAWDRTQKMKKPSTSTDGSSLFPRSSDTLLMIDSTVEPLTSEPAPQSSPITEPPAASVEDSSPLDEATHQEPSPIIEPSALSVEESIFHKDHKETEEDDEKEESSPITEPLAASVEESNSLEEGEPSLIDESVVVQLDDHKDHSFIQDEHSHLLSDHELLSSQKNIQQPLTSADHSTIFDPTFPESFDMTDKLPLDKKNTVSSTAMDRARTLMLEKLVAENQQLQVQVMNFEVYKEISLDLEQQNAQLTDSLSKLEQEFLQIQQKFESHLQETSQFSQEKTQLLTELNFLQNRLSETQATLQQEQVSHENHITRLQEEIETLTQKLTESEKTIELQQEEFEAFKNQPAPLPEIKDTFSGTDLEKQVKKELFVASVMAGEVQHLEKIAKNTALEETMAQWAFVVAAETGQLACLQWIYSHYSIHPGCLNELPLLKAVQNRHLEVIRWLVAKGASLHHADNFALRYAVATDDLSLAKFLVQLGANPRAASDRALVEAADHQAWSCFEWLLAHGCTGIQPDHALHPVIQSQFSTVESFYKQHKTQMELLRSLSPNVLAALSLEHQRLKD